MSGMRSRIFAAVLFSTTALYPARAEAGPLLGLLGGIILGATGIITPLVGLGAIGIVNAGYAFGAFLTSGLGALLLSAGSVALQYVLNRPRQQTMEAARINTRIENGTRWLHAGKVRAGGQAAFGEFDGNGNFWYLLIHGDSELLTNHGYILDEIPVVLDGSNRVTTKEFTRTNTEGGAPWLTIWTTTYTPADPVPPPIAAFKAAFPEWGDDHKLAGTTYSVIKCDAMKAEDRYKAYRWRGPFGIGEPSVSLVGTFSRVYDPREESHDIDDPSTWEGTRNAELIWAWFRTHKLGRNKPMSSIAWDKVAENADVCDETVVDKDMNEVPRYACGISIPDNKERHVGEAEIQLAADASIFFDETGKCWAEVGHWYEPTLTLSKARDIYAMAKREAQDGEMQTDGVVVTYIEPEFGYIRQDSAPWKNPDFFEEGRTPNYLKVEILACQEHNQAVRLAKALGLRSQAKHRLAPTAGLRGLRAARERIIDLQYPPRYVGAYEVATPLEEDEAGLTCGFGIVPVDADRWDLLEGEEGDRPVSTGQIEYDDTLPYASGVTVAAAPVPGSNGAAVRLEAVFSAPSRADYRFEWQYRKDGDTIYRPMLTLMDDLLSYSDTVEDGATYEVQTRTVTLSGRANDWKSPPYEVTAQADLTPPSALAAFSVTGGPGPLLGNVPLSFTTVAGDTHLSRISLYRVPHGVTLNKATHFFARIAAVPGVTFGYVIGDPAPTNLFTTADFSATGAWTLGTDFSIAAGVLTHVAGSSSEAYQSPSLSAGNWRFGAEIVAETAAGAGLRFRLGGGTPSNSAPFSGTGWHFAELAHASNTTAGFVADTWQGSLDNAVLYKETAGSTDSGDWDWYAIPENGSGVEGTQSSAQRAIVV